MAGDTAEILAGKGGKERVCLGQMWAVWERKLAVPLKSCQRALGAGRGLQLRQTLGQTDFRGSGLWGIGVAEGTVLHPITGRGSVGPGRRLLPLESFTSVHCFAPSEQS